MKVFLDESVFWTKCFLMSFFSNWDESVPNQGGGEEGWASKGGGPNISLFFPSPVTIFFLSSLSWGSSRGILVVFEARGPDMCTCGLSGCRVKPRRPKAGEGGLAEGGRMKEKTNF